MSNRVDRLRRDLAEADIVAEVAASPGSGGGASARLARGPDGDSGDQARVDPVELVRVAVPARDWSAAGAVVAGVGADAVDLVTAVDDPPERIDVLAHLVDMQRRPLWRVLLATGLDRGNPTIPTLTASHPGAAWHEREMAEMFGITVAGHPDPRPLLLSASGLAGTPHQLPSHPLRKDVSLPERERPWPGAVEVSDPQRARRRRGRQARPPGSDPLGSGGRA